MAIANIMKDVMKDYAEIERLYRNKEKYTTSKVVLQRGNSWTYEQKSNLIESIFLNISISNITVNNRNGEYRLISGNHRFRAIIGFIDNSYFLTGIREPIIVNLDAGDETIEYDLNGKYFDDLPFELKQIFLKKRVDIEILDNLNDKEEAEYILRKNSGTSMDSISKARIESFDLITPFLLETKNMPLFKRKLKISANKKEHFFDESIINTIVAYECGLGSMKMTNYEMINRIIRQEELFTDDIKNKIRSGLEYLDNIIPSRTKWMNVQNLIVLYLSVEELQGLNASNIETNALINTFFNNTPEDYNVGGSWHSSKAISNRIFVFDSWLKQNVKNLKEETIQ